MKLYDKFKQKMREGWTRLHQIKDAPHSVAGGVAIGIFWGFTPLTGFKTLFSMGTAWAVRCSRLAAVIAVTFHDILLPVWPVVLRWEYQLGYWILSHPHQFPPKLTHTHLHIAELFRWKTLEILKPLMLGSCIIGLPVALVSYYVVERLLERYESKHHRHLTPPP